MYMKTTMAIMYDVDMCSLSLPTSQETKEVKLSTGGREHARELVQVSEESMPLTCTKT